ncbi:MAG: hypothetical protein LC130_31335 [Bryobacterales bacterium]|nr:hypothetical protein [Bryobacterales bacterium]MEB2363014.1 hypothetical protein [Bryobacterales bacterium]
MLTRRKMLHAATLAGGALFARRPVLLQGTPAQATTVGDCLWLWSHIAGAYSGQYGLVGESRITPVEAAHYMSIPNVFMIGYEGQPDVRSLEQFAIPFQSLRQVVWSIVDPGENRTPDSRRNAVVEFAFRNPQTTGVVMDDFFVRRKHWEKDRIAALSLEELKQVKQGLQSGDKRLDLWVVLYAHEIAQDSFPRLGPYLDLCDVVQVWPWFGKEIPNLPRTLERVEKVAPRVKKALGSFLWDFGDKKPLPVSAMKRQCEFGLEWLRKGRIEAMVICGSWLCDRPLETVGWTRRWIRETGKQKL